MSETLDITEFHTFREHIRKACGLCFTDDKYERVAKVVRLRMSELGIQPFSEYLELLSTSLEGNDELAMLAAHLTVGETYLFRNTDHWRAFEECVVPWIMERNTPIGERRLRLWSAGCSTGEEAYTMAIVLERSLPDKSRWTIDIVGTDISPAAIAMAQRAVYTENSFRGVPLDIKDRYFEPAKKSCHRLRADVRDMVRFEELNLLDEKAVARMHNFDVIFCRNVLIYFDASGVQTVVGHLHRSLRPDGYLFLGHAENLSGGSAGFASVNVCSTFIYKRIPRLARDVDPVDIAQTAERTFPPVTTPTGSSEARGPGAERCMPAVKTANKIGRTEAHSHVRGKAPADAPADAGEPAPREQAASTESMRASEKPSLDELRAEAVAYLCAERNAKARRAFGEILECDPNDVHSLLAMALLLAGGGNNEAALQSCDHVLQLNPMSAEAYYTKALVHEGLGEDGMTQRELEKAVYLDDAFSIAHFRLASLHDRMKRPDAVARELSNVIKALPSDDEQRVRIYSGGFDKETVRRICEQRLGVESAKVSEINS